ncbi:hypothetical protein B0T44_12100 [Nocardia donostiensis]|uniref:DUF4878 domain-containing protein n=2 Tax=Nocardia donostiensis TaxID=1538463 RepID=A0A1W0BBU1_9NOCA|nr:hypothetical protein B0T46_06425 [Nocardia donostiensis]OQS13605.1 hypothetical protein B0T36_19150 [Nocardia donostiensis]OQS20010.1 hypothetical protein B0T44_12100 [Nocardia donostiensis]
MVLPIVGSADAETMALPVQRPDAGRTERINMADAKKPGPQGHSGTDRVSGGPRQALSKPPSTPRPAPGPKQSGPGPQPGPGGPQQRPSVSQQPPNRPPHQGAPRPQASAPSPADIQPTVAAHQVSGPRPQPHLAQPQRVGPAPTAAEPAAGGGKPKRWLIVAGAAAVLVVALIAALVVGSGDDSPQAQIRNVITSYTQALEDGDLAALRSATCGSLHDFYQGLSEDQFAGVHQQSVEQGSIPEVTSVDAIRITDNTAIAQATVHTEADPATSARTFDLQHTDDGWKVCDPPAGTP